MFRAYLGIDPQTGSPRRTTRRGFTNERNARNELKRIEYEATQGLNTVQVCNKTFEEVYHEWYKSYINTVRESTWVKTVGIFKKHILPAFGRYRIRTITTAQCQTSLNKWFKIATCNYKRWFNYAESVFEYAIRQGYITDNPAKRVVMPKKNDVAEKKAPNFWDRSQLKTFFSYIDPNKELERYTLFRLLAFTGIRRGECLALRWDDIDTKNSTLSVNKTLTRGASSKQIIQATKTKKGTRIISLDSTTLLYLKKWRLEQKQKLFMLGFNVNNSSQLIFTTTKNTFKSLNAPKIWLDIITSRMKQDNIQLPYISIHGFRHSHASALFSAGATIKEVQERLGHANVQTTLNIYTHVTTQQDKEAAKKLVNFLDF